MESPLLRAGVAAAQNALRMLPNASVKTEEVKAEDKVVKVEVKKEFSPAVFYLNKNCILLFSWCSSIPFHLILGCDMAIQGQERWDSSCQEKEDWVGICAQVNARGCVVCSGQILFLGCPKKYPLNKVQHYFVGGRTFCPISHFMWNLHMRALRFPQPILLTWSWTPSRILKFRRRPCTNWRSS